MKYSIQGLFSFLHLISKHDVAPRMQVRIIFDTYEEKARVFTSFGVYLSQESKVPVTYFHKRIHVRNNFWSTKCRFAAPRMQVE